MIAIDPYEMKLEITDESDGHVTVCLEPAHWPDWTKPAVRAVTRAEWHHARVYQAGVISRVGVVVSWEAHEKLACSPGCGDCGGHFCANGHIALNPHGDWGSNPWVEVTVPQAAKKQLIALFRACLARVGECDSLTFTEAEEQEWQGGAT